MLQEGPYLILAYGSKNFNKGQEKRPTTHSKLHIEPRDEQNGTMEYLLKIIAE